MKKTALSLLLLTVSFAASIVSVAQAEIRISGSTTVEANLFAPYQSVLERKLGVNLKVNGNGSSRGIIDLIENRSDMAMISAPLEEVLKKIDIHADSLDAAKFQVHELGETQIQFGTNIGNVVAMMSKKEIKQALSGYKTSWKDFGGDDVSVTVVTEYAGGGFRTVVEKDLLLGAEFSHNLVEGKDGKEIIDIARNVPGSLVVATKKIMTQTKGVRPLLVDFKLAQPLYLITKGEPTADEKALIKQARELLAL